MPCAAQPQSQLGDGAFHRAGGNMMRFLQLLGDRVGDSAGASSSGLRISLDIDMYGHVQHLSASCALQGLDCPRLSLPITTPGAGAVDS